MQNMAKLETQLKQKDDQISQLQSSLSQSQSELQEMQAKYKTTSTELKDLQAKYAKLKEYAVKAKQKIPEDWFRIAKILAS
jgi:peptidoglycan hydrolase CwlO-like protein